MSLDDVYKSCSEIHAPPGKSMLHIASAKLGDGAYFAVVSGTSGKSHTSEYWNLWYLESGVEKLTRSSLEGLSNRAIFAYKNGRFASRFLHLGIGFL